MNFVIGIFNSDIVANFVVVCNICDKSKNEFVNSSKCFFEFLFLILVMVFYAAAKLPHEKVKENSSNLIVVFNL